MVIYDRSPLLGSCLAETIGWPLLMLGIAVLIAGVVRFLTRRFAPALTVLTWIVLGVGVISAVIALAVFAQGVTARVVRLDRQVMVTHCRLGMEETATYDVSAARGSFAVSNTSGRGRPLPVVHLDVDGRTVADIWIGEHTNLEALATIAPTAVVDFRRWRDQRTGREGVTR